MRRFQILFTFILSLNLLIVSPAFAAPQADVMGDQAVMDFPNTVTFSATISAGANIILSLCEYGADQLTCGDV